MWLDADDLRSDIKSLIAEAEEENSQTNYVTASVMKTGEIMGYHKVIKMIDEQEAAYTKMARENYKRHMEEQK